MDPLLIMFPALITTGIVVGFFAHILWLDFNRRGKAWVLFHDPDAGTYQALFKKLVGNQFTHAEKTYILDDDARGAFGNNPAWIVHPRHGWNYRAPGDRETVDSDPLRLALAVTNPASYHLAVARNRARDSLNANSKDDKWGWVPMVAFALVVAIIAVLGTVIYIATTISKGGVPVPGGG